MARNKIYGEKLKEAFRKYMQTGGFPLSIIDYYRFKRVSLQTIRTYLNWMRGDWHRVGKSEKYMKEVISYILRARGTPISWNGIASETGINSPHTVKSYVEVLEDMFVAKVLHFIAPNMKVMYRKNKKVHFTDPLIYRVFGEYTEEKVDEDSLYEGVVASILGRKCPVFYWRNSTEVDVVCRIDHSLIGFEVASGLKRWSKPRFLRKAYLLDKNTMPLILSALD